LIMIEVNIMRKPMKEKKKKRLYYYQ